MNSLGPQMDSGYDSETARSLVVSSLISYAHSQTFLSGSNLATTPTGNVFFDRDEYDTGDEAGAEDDEDEEDDRDRLLRAAAHDDEEFLVGSHSWDEDPPSPTTATTLGPPTLLPSPPRPIAIGGSRPQRTRTRITSTPSIPTTSTRANRGRATSTRSPPARFSPPLATHVEGRPSSAPVIPRFMPSSPPMRLDERTPLLTVSSASSTYGSPTTSTPASEVTVTGLRVPSPSPKVSPRRSSQRRRSSVRKIHVPPGKSTYGQTLFNSIAILLGIGMLSCPLAFACSGWVGGFGLVIFYGFITCYTAKVLAKMILENPNLRTYADIGQAAFGPRSNIITSSLFCLELFAVSVILVVLFSDSLHEVIPMYSSNTYKIFGLLVIIPTSFLPLRILSFASILGVLSTFMLIFVLLTDGTTKLHAPGSLWEPSKTEWIPENALVNVPIAFGLFMAGFSGHAVIPSIVRDMQDPSQYRSMINWAFFVATVVYGIIGAAGYCMFGHGVAAEVSQDLLRTPGFNKFLNKVALWMLVMSPLTKFSLSARPMNVTIEILFGIEESTPVPSHNRPRRIPNHNTDTEADGKDYFTSTDDENPQNLYISPNHARLAMVERRKAIGRIIERTTLAIVVVLVAIYVPDFTTSMAFLGAFSAFTLCVIGPLAAKMSVERRITFHDTVLIVIATIMATWATYIAITTA